jgi:hypothetical protein
MRWCTLAVAVVVVLAGCGGGDPCSGVTCADFGTCVAPTGIPRCLCDPGSVESGLACVPLWTLTCTDTGALCSSSGECCNFRKGEGSCVSGRCTDSCTENADCRSGCCAPLVGGGKACGPVSQCSPACAPVGRACTTNGDCCNFINDRGYCVDGVCADSCVLNSECTSNCCAPLVGGGFTCSPRSSCP